jgi:hypothetical protein
MSHLEYIIGYGLANDFGRFRASSPLSLSRGALALIRGDRGVEVGRVLRPATPGHAAFLPNTTVGKLLRAVGRDDEARLAEMTLRAGEVLERGTQLIQGLDLPVMLLDAECLFDGEHAALHCLHWGPSCDMRDLVSTLSREFAVTITLVDLTAPVAEENNDCGNCGRDGGCGSCSEGGCSGCGSVSSAAVQAHFAELREKMERRVALL